MYPSIDVSVSFLKMEYYSLESKHDFLKFLLFTVLILLSVISFYLYIGSYIHFVFSSHILFNL